MDRLLARFLQRSCDWLTSRADSSELAELRDSCCDLTRDNGRLHERLNLMQAKRREDWARIQFLEKERDDYRQRWGDCLLLLEIELSDETDEPPYCAGTSTPSAISAGPHERTAMVREIAGFVCPVCGLSDEPGAA